MEQTGCHDFEIHPTKAIVSQADAARKNGGAELLERVVGSVHQTFNEGTGIYGKLADHRGVLRSPDSVRGMFVIQRALPRPVPSIHYPTREDMTHLPIHPINGNRMYPGTFPVAQPAVGVYKEFNVQTNKRLLCALAARGIIGLVPDTVHARCKAEDGTAPPAIADVWADQFASGKVYEAHLSSDRFDLAKRDPEMAATSQEEFKAFTSRRWQDARDTDMGNMIVAAVESWVPPPELAQTAGQSVLRMVIEVPPRPRPGVLLRRIAQHARFVDNVAEIVREAGATPRLWEDR